MAGVYTALFNYTTEIEEELALIQGETIEIKEINDTGWWMGTNDRGRSGWCPSNYLKRNENQPQPKSEPAPEPVQEEPEPEPQKEDRICHACKETITSDFVVARDKHFHVDHFICCMCEKNLTGQHFAVEDDEFYCIDDYHEKFSPKCAHCKEPIKGKYITALGKTWHNEHFVCTTCHKPFPDNRFRKKDDLPYCEEHYQQQFGVKCYKCGQVITGKVFDAFGKQCHLECFVCEVDGARIGEGEPFHVQDEKVYCVSHFEDLFLEKCKRCNKPIQDQFIQVLDFHFHSDCWTCENCEKSLADGNFDQLEDSFLCRTCIGELKKPQKKPQKPKKVPEKKVSNVIQVKPKEEPKPEPKPAPVPVPEFDKIDEEKKSEAALDEDKYYSYEQLKNNKDTLPPSVKRNMLERYLSPEEFQQVFKMTLREFQAKRIWRQAQLKRAVGLF